MAAAFPYRLHGGATRPDALQFNPDFNRALLNLFQAAPPEVQRELGLTSGYRSPEVQQVLWDKSDKTGHSVAAPGKSRHQHGTAADLHGFGLKGGGNVSQTTKDWVHQNAAAYGLGFPMGHEPWHIQLVGGGGGGGQVTPLATTLADAAIPPEDLAKEQLVTGLIRGLGRSSERERNQSPELVADPAAPPAVGLPIESAVPLPTAPATSLLPAVTAPTLADLFRVKNIGAVPAQPGRRF